MLQKKQCVIESIPSIPKSENGFNQEMPNKPLFTTLILMMPELAIDGITAVKNQITNPILIPAIAPF